MAHDLRPLRWHIDRFLLSGQRSSEAMFAILVCVNPVLECHPSVHAAPFFPSTRLDSNLTILKFNVLTSFHFLPFPFLLLSFPDFAFISSISFQFLACSCHIPVFFFHLAWHKPNTGPTQAQHRPNNAIDPRYMAQDRPSKHAPQIAEEDEFLDVSGTFLCTLRWHIRLTISGLCGFPTNFHFLPFPFISWFCFHFLIILSIPCMFLSHSCHFLPSCLT